jgi:hypothetical protein
MGTPVTGALMPDKASDSGERGAITKDIALNAAGKVLWFLVTGLVLWCLHSVNNHEGRMIKIETKQDGTEQFIKEIRQDIKDIKDELKKRP